MKFIRRVIQQVNNLLFGSYRNEEINIQLARAYRPASGMLAPRWRNLGVMITPYHFMRPVLIPVKQKCQPEDFRSMQ